MTIAMMTLRLALPFSVSPLDSRVEKMEIRSADSQKQFENKMQAIFQPFKFLQTIRGGGRLYTKIYIYIFVKRVF